MRRLIPALMCTVFLAACGGGNGDPFVDGSEGGDSGESGPDLFTFSGTFHAMGMLTNGTTSNTVFYGPLAADAVGAYSIVASVNTDGSLPPGGPAAADDEYSVDPGGGLTVGGTLGGFGGMNPDKDVAAISSFFGGLSVWLRRGGSFDVSSLNGTYRFVSKIAASSSTLLSLGGTIVFDGAGAGTFMPEFLNNEGNLQGTADDPLTYTVSADGDVEIDIRGMQTLRGGIARGGEILAVAGGALAGQDPMVVYAIRQRTGATTSQLTGGYTLVLDRFAQVTHDRLGLSGTLSADGGATASFRDLLTLTPLPSIPVSISDDGQIDATLDGGYRVRGAISAAGDVAFLAGGIDDGFDPGLMALVRKRDLGPRDDLPLNLVRSASIPQTPPFGAAFGDQAAPLFSSRRITVGEVEEAGVLGVPGVFNGEGERALLQFDLAGLSPGRTVSRVVLETVRSASEGAPFALGVLQVDHVVTVGFPVFADYDPARRPLGHLGTLADQPTATTLSLDVTAAVKADITDARPASSFLLYFPTPDNGDNVQDRLILDDHGGPGPTLGPRTRLVITYE